MTKIVKQLKSEGYPVNEEELSRISPFMFKHIVVTEIYSLRKAQAAKNNLHWFG